MLRNMFGQILSGLFIAGLLCGWWLAAGQDFGRMADQLINLVMWVGHLFEPLVNGLFSQAEK